MLLNYQIHGSALAKAWIPIDIMNSNIEANNGIRMIPERSEFGYQTHLVNSSKSIELEF